MSKQQRSAGKTPRASSPTAGSTRGRRQRSSSKPGPGRPSAARVEAINRDILVEAHKEFLKSGYEDTQMETIAAAAGISKRTLYDRYPNKPALLKAVVAERVEAWSKDWQRDVDEIAPDLRIRLKHRARGIMETCCSGEFERVQRFLASSPSMDDLRRMGYEVGHRPMAQAIAKEIVDLTTDQVIQPQSALRLAEMLMGMLYGWWLAHLGVRHITREEARAFADHAVDVLIDGRSSWGPALLKTCR